MDVEKLLTIEDLAERFSVPRATIYQWNSRAIGPKYLRVGKYVRYRLSDVIAWENDHYGEAA